MAARRPTIPPARPVINLEDWEAKAPLGDLENRSVNLVKTASEYTSLPFKFSVDEPGPSSRSSSPAPRNRLLAISRPGTPNLNAGHPAARSQAVNTLHPKHPIQTPQQFYDWFALIDRSVAHSQEAHFRAHLSDVAGHLETCDRLVQWIDEIESEVDEMIEGWRSVEEGGKSLKDACEQLLEERDKLLEMTDSIGTRLEYFQELEHATRMLNHPGESLVLQTDFLYMVERVDICIDYLKAHRHFREAEIYLLRFQQCLTRAMTLIKMYFVGSLRALVADVTKRISEKGVSTTAQTHLLYTRFTTVSSQLAPLLAELERRAVAHPDELSALLAECHTAYFSARRGLLVPRLMEEIKGLDPARTELVELNLCDYLYDDLRPRILHEPRLTALCEVCTVLQALMVLDVPDIGPEDEEEDSELNLDLEKPRHKGLRTLHISHLLQMVLQDAQTRLFFKAQSVIQSEIRYYVPKAEDLAYPDKLVSARRPATGAEIKEKESINEIFRFKSFDKQDTWYPTLRKTVWVLSQLHDFVKPAIFDDIAQEAVNLCRQSLVAGADAIRSKNLPSSTFDGQLFLVRHLLILKEMTQNLDFATRNSDRTLDLTAVTDTLASMLSKTTSLLPNALFASLGMPKEENLADVKHGIDHELKRACEDVIASCADAVCRPLRAWLERVAQYHAAGPQEPLAAQDWASPAAATGLLAGFREACHRDLRAAVARLGLYLEDDRTVSVLVKHAQERIVDEYGEFRRVVWGEYGEKVSGMVSGDEELRALLREVCEESEGSNTHAEGSDSVRRQTISEAV
ncbi:hypothetical protein EIP86_001025 [Pleurotus ostreatoroseus]|nr:hypothetical protein EIP86_001025 [Pleurotus ostreatoroseus]